MANITVQELDIILQQELLEEDGNLAAEMGQDCE
jgi:hypothetical protein